MPDYAWRRCPPRHCAPAVVAARAAQLGRMPPLYRWVDAQGWCTIPTRRSRGPRKSSIAPAQTYHRGAGVSAAQRARPRRRPPPGPTSPAPSHSPRPSNRSLRPRSVAVERPADPAPAGGDSAGRQPSTALPCCQRVGGARLQLSAVQCRIAARTRSSAEVRDAAGNTAVQRLAGDLLRPASLAALATVARQQATDGTPLLARRRSDGH